MIFTKENLPTGPDKKYHLCVNGNGSGDKFTILESRGQYLKVSLNKLKSVIDAMNDELTKYDMKELEKLSLNDLSKLKQETSQFGQECKEFQQKFDTLKERVKQFAEAVDKQMNPDTNYEVLFVYIHFYVIISRQHKGNINNLF